MNKSKKIIIILSAIITVTILLGIVALANNKSDDQLILGCWKLEKEERVYNGLDDYPINGMDERIQEFIFYSDGRCTVGGQHGQDEAAWSIVDGNLRIDGTLLFSYDNFISEYELNDDELIIKQSTGTDKYYRIEQSDMKWIK